MSHPALLLRTFSLSLLAAGSLALAACGDDGGGGSSDASVTDADPNAPDADPNAPDADPNAPDANPNAPDANPNAPDANPNAPDAGSTSCTGGLEMCGVGCVDTQSDDRYCGNCATSCGLGTSCIGGTCLAGVGGLVLSEIHAHQPAYFELHNGGSTTIDLQNHLVQWSSDTLGSGSVILPSYSLAPGAFVVLSEDGGTNGNGVIYLDTSVGWLQGIAVRLINPVGVGLDFVRTGTAVSAPPTGTTWTGNNAGNPNGTVDQSLVRNVYVADTDSAADWTLTTPSSPGSYCASPGKCGSACYAFESDRNNCGGCGVVCGGTQLCLDGACSGGATHLWISEYRRYPRAAVEIHNPRSTAETMTGYRLDMSGANNLSYTFPAFVLQPGAFVTVFMGNGENDSTSLYAGPSRAFDDDVAIALYNAGTTALDFVRFGTSSEPAPVDAPWFGNSVAAVSNLANFAARRDLEKLDTDGAADWTSASPATLGFACYPGLSMCSGQCKALAEDPQHCGDCGVACGDNETCSSGLCVASGAVVISELKNSSPEAIELFNGSAVAVDLSNWTLDWVADAVGAFVIPSGTIIPPGGYIYFYEGSGTSTATVIRMGSTILINWNDFIAVALSNASTVEVDFVRTGTSVTTGTWTGANATNPTNSQSLVRQVYSADTNSAADFAVGVATAAAGCATNESVCGAACVNLQTSADDCGACGNVCGTGGICYQGACVEPGAVRLGVGTAGDGTDRGRIEVFHNSRWNTVNSFSTGPAGASVACKQMGFTSGTTTASTFGACTGCGSIYSVSCTGAEARLIDCTHTFSSTNYAGVRVTCAP